MKKILILTCLILAFGVTKAQKKQNVYFFKNDGKEVSEADSSDFVRIIQEPDSGDTNFVLLEYYVNKKRKTLGKVSAFEPSLVLEGPVSRFNQEGKRIELTTYEKGVPLGVSYHYFDNGKFHKQITYGNTTPKLEQAMGLNSEFNHFPFNPNAKLIYLADSNGVEQVKDGNGHAKEIRVSEKNVVTEEGDYKDGVKHGVWTGGETMLNYTYTETYEMGKLVAGESIKDNQTHQYTTNAMNPPQFKGGINKFYQNVGYALRYPAEAARNRITGSVILSFTVEKDGSITDVEVKKSAHKSLDEEAKRVVLLSKKWLPATMRGIPVRVKYTLPIKFSMSGS